MELRDVKKLLDAVVAADVDEFTYETGDVKISVKRGGVPQVVSAPPIAPPAAVVTEPASAQVQAHAAAGPEIAGASAKKAGQVEITAPIVGTFYAAPAPDAASFVKVGDHVSAGTVLCIIEAMKLMNEIEAETSGTIADILVRNEEPVEYGQALFRIDPD